MLRDLILKSLKKYFGTVEVIESNHSSQTFHITNDMDKNEIETAIINAMLDIGLDVFGIRDKKGLPKNLSEFPEYYLFKTAEDEGFGLSFKVIGKEDNHWIVISTMNSAKSHKTNVRF